MKYILVPYDRYEMMLKTEKKSHTDTSFAPPQLVHQTGASMQSTISTTPRLQRRGKPRKGTDSVTLSQGGTEILPPPRPPSMGKKTMRAVVKKKTSPPSTKISPRSRWLKI